MTKAVHCKKEKYDVYIGRPSIWGNPFSHLEESSAEFKCKTREESIEKYKQWILTQPELIAKAKIELKDKILGCWCKPKSCHGDILASIADS